MHKKLIKPLIIILILILSIFLPSCMDKEEISLLSLDTWESDVKDNINALIKTYRNTNNYVVFDFDNTSSIFDIEEQLAIYQLETMAFEIKPNELKDVLLTNLSTEDNKINGYGYFIEDTKEMTYDDLCDDIVSAYNNLYTKYGPFSANGLSIDQQNQIQSEDDYKDFSTKIRMMYDLVYTKESASVAYPWILNWFYNMTEEEVYNLAYKSHEKYSKELTEEISLETSGTGTKCGAVKFNCIIGISVTNNIKELYKALSDNNIDVYICSASDINVVRAAVDCFGLHDYVKGILAMTNKIVDSKYTNEYDYETGYGYLSQNNLTWIKMTKATKAQTQGVGKVTAINNTLYIDYDNKGPIAGFMDSTGDFNFCTEYESLKLVVCFNRANRKVTDGGGLIAPLAMYQKDVLKYDLAKANANNDTLYLLQGRDENNYRSLRNSNKTILYNDTIEKLYKNDDNIKLYEYFKLNNLSTKEIINSFSIKTTADNALGIKYGFLSTYNGYHSIKNK